MLRNNLNREMEKNKYVQEFLSFGKKSLDSCMNDLMTSKKMEIVKWEINFFQWKLREMYRVFRFFVWMGKFCIFNPNSPQTSRGTRLPLPKQKFLLLMEDSHKITGDSPQIFRKSNFHQNFCTIFNFH